MSCNSCNCNKENKCVLENGNMEICICDTQYKVSAVENNNCLRIYASPCTLPSCTFEVCQICKKQNSCMQFDFYESQVYTDPVVFIIDCNLCQIIKRSIEIYLDEVDNTNFGGNNCNTNIFGF